MNAVFVSYRFSRVELSTLLQAMRIGSLPGAPLNPVDEATASETLKHICDEGRAMIADETLYVDKLIGYLLRSAAQSKSAVALTDGSRTAVLWAAEKLYILGDFPEQGECALTPLQDMEAVHAALADALCRMSRPIWALSVFTPDRRDSIPADSPLTGPEAALRMAALLDPENQSTRR